MMLEQKIKPPSQKIGISKAYETFIRGGKSFANPFKLFVFG